VKNQNSCIGRKKKTITGLNLMKVQILTLTAFATLGIASAAVAGNIPTSGSGCSSNCTKPPVKVDPNPCGGSGGCNGGIKNSKPATVNVVSGNGVAGATVVNGVGHATSGHTIFSTGKVTNVTSTSSVTVVKGTATANTVGTTGAGPLTGTLNLNATATAPGAGSKKGCGTCGKTTAKNGSGAVTATAGGTVGQTGKGSTFLHTDMNAVKAPGLNSATGVSMGGFYGIIKVK
jgi:hypothetical protein